MTEAITAPVLNLDGRYLLDHPLAAAKRVERIEPAIAASALMQQPTRVLVPVFENLSPDSAARVIREMSIKVAAPLLAELRPMTCAALLGQFEVDEQKDILAQLDSAFAADLQTYLDYPEQTAGRIMDTRFATYRAEMSVSEAIDRLRSRSRAALRSVFIVDDENRLEGVVDIGDLVTASPDAAIEKVALPPPAVARVEDPQDSVVALFDRHKLAEMPVVDFDGRLVGIIRHEALVSAVERQFSVDMQTMVGASKDERALSPIHFAVRKRLPWLHINLLTAFLAAAVVGLFEGTIAQFTALAILLPVVAGQSGNAGAQSLAVTMRGLALREISPRNWVRVTVKEASVGLANGIAVAVTCGVGVFFWSGSLGLAIVIFLSMIIAMFAAGISGALVPIVLSKLGQDPAQASSIILTTVTDVVGFFSFLGIATLMASFL